MKAKISFFFTTDKKTPGKVLLGGYDLKKYAEKGLKESDIMWSNLVSEAPYFWTLKMASELSLDGG
jgi:hypothetical protein